MKKLFALLAIGVLVLLSACQTYKAPTSIPTSLPAPTVSDSSWQTPLVQAWVDMNENGKWDANEEPVADVEFVVKEVICNKPDSFIVTKGRTDKTGKVQLSFSYSLKICTMPWFEFVVVGTPAGYELISTTRSDFGFRKIVK